MTYKIVAGTYEDDPMLQQLIFEGVNEMVQNATYPSDGLDLMVHTADQIIYAVDDKDNDVVGVLCFRIELGVAEISLVYVEPASRRQGVATGMMNCLNTKMISKGINRKATSIRAANEVAKIVLGKFGFVSEVVRMEAATNFPG